jgi:hypothetical protein
MRVLLLLLVLTASPALAVDLSPLPADQAEGLVGAPVLSADAVPMGRLIAAQVTPEGDLVCIVRLDAALSSRTSPLLVNGLLRAPDGSLRLPEPASVLADRMHLSLP